MESSAAHSDNLSTISPKIKMKFDISLEYTVDSSADFIFNIHAAKTPHQIVISEHLEIGDFAPNAHQFDDFEGNRWLRIKAAPGTLKVQYAAVIDLSPVVMQPENLQETPINDLPPTVLPYLRSSRYCQSDRLLRMAFFEFGHLQPGYARVEAIQHWVRSRLAFRIQTSDITTSAMDTLVEQVGVCRDYAHLMIALCRALNIPARFATGIDYGADPALGPIDFHAYVEVFLGERWYIFDPSGLAIPMGFVRLGTGRDASDVAFATIYGSVQTGMPKIDVHALEEPESNYVLPYHTNNLISTAA
jgi:transglutaminase-like putative cysteine protease